MYQYNSHQYYASFAPQSDNNDISHLSSGENINYYNNSLDYSNYYYNQRSFQYYSSPPDYQYDRTNSDSGYFSNISLNNFNQSQISNFNQSPVSNFNLSPISYFSQSPTSIISSNDTRVYSKSTPVLPIQTTTSDTKTAEIIGGRNLDTELDFENHQRIEVARKSGRKRTDFTYEQRRYLLIVFTQNKYPSKDTLEFIANKFEMKFSVIQTWFKNTRSKQKKLTNTKNL